MSRKSRNRYRADAVHRQGGRCFYCGQPMWLANRRKFAAENGLTLSQARQRRCTAEHLIPRCEGGREERDNIVAACRECNEERGQCKTTPSPAQWCVIRSGHTAAQI